MKRKTTTSAMKRTPLEITQYILSNAIEHKNPTQGHEA